MGAEPTTGWQGIRHTKIIDDDSDIVLKLSPDGAIFVDGISSGSGSYNISDIDSSGDPQYFGFLGAGGKWYIMEMTSSTQFRYVKGDDSYTTAWTARDSQSYDYYDEVF